MCVCYEQEPEPSTSAKPAKEADSGLEALTLSLKKQSKSGTTSSGAKSQPIVVAPEYVWH